MLKIIHATVGGKDTQIKMTSYYDKLRNITFDNKEMKLGFDMPFDWNLSRIRNVNIFVHEEISIPKPNNFTSKGGYSGLVNGIDVSKQLVLDNSNPKEDVIHFMLPKDKLVSLAEQMANSSQSSIELMKFSLKPSIEIMTDKHDIYAFDVLRKQVKCYHSEFVKHITSFSSHGYAKVKINHHRNFAFYNCNYYVMSYIQCSPN